MDEAFTWREIFAWAGFRWIAITLIFVAYILVSQGVWEGTGILYNAMNMAGSFFLITTSLAHTKRDWPIAVFNVIWLSIGLFTIVKVLFL